MFVTRTQRSEEGEVRTAVVLDMRCKAESSHYGQIFVLHIRLGLGRVMKVKLHGYSEVLVALMAPRTPHCWTLPSQDFTSFCKFQVQVLPIN